jgi:hypothetical protein
MLKYSNLKEEFEYPEAKVVEFKGEQIFIKQFLPTDKKYGILYICLMSLDLQKQPYNPLLGEILFDLEIVKEYSNIEFDDEIDSSFKQFDILQYSGLIDLIIENIPQEEYEEMQRLYNETIEYQINYNSNIGNSINSLFDNLPNLNQELEGLDPEQLEKGMEIIEKLSKEQHI